MKDLLERLLEFTRDGICRYELDGRRVLLANRGLVGILDLDCAPESLNGRNVDDLIRPARATNETLQRMLREQGEVRDFVFPFRTSNEVEKWLSLDAFVMDDAPEGRKVVEAIIRDVTAYKQAEEHRRLDEARLQTLLDLMRLSDRPLYELTDFTLENAIALTQSTIGYLAFMSEDETVLTMYSWSRSAMAECAIDNKPKVYPVESTGLWGEAVRQRRSIITNDYLGPSPWKKGYPEGHVHILRHMNIPLFDGDKIVLVAGVGNKVDPYDESDVRQLTLLMDGMWKIIKRKRIEEALREEESFISSVFNSIQDGISVLDNELTIVRVNPAMERWYAHQMPLIGKKCFIAYHGRSHACDACPTCRTMTTGQAARETVPRLGPAGEVQGWLELFSFPRQEEETGAVRGVIEYVRDVTEIRRAEEERRKLESQMQQAQKLESLGVLAGGIAHDFNNLLVGILGNADLALLKLSPAAPARESIENVVKAAQRAADLARQMLAYSGKGRFLIEPLNLSEVVEEMAHMLEVSVSKRAVLKYKFSDNLPLIEADITQMRQIIMNLITNASDAIGDRSGVISVSTGAMHCDAQYLKTTYVGENLGEGLYTYIEVSDTGCGMDAETQERIFDPFFTTKFTGRGLGLAAVLGIVRGHKGAIKVYSEPQRGSTFKVLIPAGHQLQYEQLVPQQRPEAWPGGGCVLIADDEESVRAVGQEFLEAVGFRVLTARDGLEAVKHFSEHADEVSVVILDLTMPHMDGEEAYRELRRMRPDVRVILSSGYNEQDVTQRFSGKGLAGFIQKPYRMDDLLDTLHRVLGA